MNIFVTDITVPQPDTLGEDWNMCCGAVCFKGICIYISLSTGKKYSALIKHFKVLNKVVEWDYGETCKFLKSHFQNVGILLPRSECSFFIIHKNSESENCGELEVSFEFHVSQC